ncbi:hypothetical protein RG42_23110 (plasmid) [Escherichia coli]|nr:hypothetical protein RG37_24085 [Escherichia coli]APK41570.1 hypothetical protein RG42_23110 [Escherichia coli]
MYKWGGKEGCRLLFRIYSTPDFIPRNTPTVSLRSIQGKVASRYRNGWVAFGERLEVFRETVELPVWISGEGSMPVQERWSTGIARGRVAAIHL